MRENIKRNNNIVLMFKDLKTIREIAKKYKITESTARTILLRKLGKDYLRIRRQRILMTATKYPPSYLEKRTFYNK